MERDEQIEFMLQAEERAQGYLRRWLQNDEYRAALHLDDCHEDDGPRAAHG